MDAVAKRPKGGLPTPLTEHLAGAMPTAYKLLPADVSPGALPRRRGSASHPEPEARRVRRGDRPRLLYPRRRRWAAAWPGVLFSAL